MRCADKDESSTRAVRGGSWSLEPRWVRSATRFRVNPTYRINIVLGFRLARSL